MVINFLEWFFPSLFFCFEGSGGGSGSEGSGASGGGDGEGGGGNGDGSGDSSGDIDYKTEYEKRKDIDLEKYNRLKDFDEEAYSQDKELLDEIYENEELFNHVSEIRKALKSGKKLSEILHPGQQLNGQDGRRQPENKRNDLRDPRVDRLLQEREDERSERVAREFDSSFDKALESVLKDKKIELFEHKIGEEVFRSDREDVKRFVEDAFIQDWNNSQKRRTQPKLSIKDIPALVTKALEALDGYWNTGIQKRVKPDQGPEHLSGGSSGFQKKQLPPKDKNERISRMAEDLKKSSHFAGQTS